MKIGRFLRETVTRSVPRAIENTRGDFLGRLEWNGDWRCWEFVPAPHVGLTSECLRDLAEHLSRQAPPRSGM